MKYKTLSLLIVVFGIIASPVKAEPNPVFLKVKLPAMDGSGEYSVADFSGKVVLLDFWASWCGPCRLSFPVYQQLHEKYKDKGLVIIGVNTEKSKKNADKFLNSFEPDFLLLKDTRGLAVMMKLPTMPTSFLINRRGEIIHTHKGFRPGEGKKIEEMVKKALSK